MKILTLNKSNIQDFSLARNQLLGQVSEPWVLFLDTDEKLSAPLPEKLDPKYNYQFRRQDWFLGRKLRFGETANLKFVRLVQPGTGRWKGKVHERFVSDLPVKTLPQIILHQRRVSLSNFLDRLNYYTDLRANELGKFSLFELLFYPWLKFVKTYFFQLGFLDGIPGLAISFFMSLHSLFVRIKLYEKNFNSSSTYSNFC
mgnify:CR=1 FL=1